MHVEKNHRGGKNMPALCVPRGPLPLPLAASGANAGYHPPGPCPCRFEIPSKFTFGPVVQQKPPLLACAFLQAEREGIAQVRLQLPQYIIRSACVALSIPAAYRDKHGRAVLVRHYHAAACRCRNRTRRRACLPLCACLRLLLCLGLLGRPARRVQPGEVSSSVSA